MMFTRVRLRSWRNFDVVDVPLGRRVFLVGPNASGKSNFLDVFQFLREIADPQGGFQRAVQQPRRGISQIRSLHARRWSDIVIEVEMELGDDRPWSYRLQFNQDRRHRAILKREVARHGKEVLCDRPDAEDRADPERMTETRLEHVGANQSFRPIAEFLADVRYLHIVPQLVRDPDRSVGKVHDPYGGDFLEQLARTPKRILDSRLRRIRDALRIAVPRLKEIRLERDKLGTAHLTGLYEHWRPKAGWQQADQFSDGTLRLLGLLWSLLDGTAPLLLEEPELSLHSAIVRQIPGMMHRASIGSGRQVVVSTHSPDLLVDEGIGPEEVLLLVPGHEATWIEVAAHDREIRALLENGIPMGEAVLPRVAPRDAEQLLLFGG